MCCENNSPTVPSSFGILVNIIYSLYMENSLFTNGQ